MAHQDFRKGIKNAQSIFIAMQKCLLGRKRNNVFVNWNFINLDQLPGHYAGQRDKVSKYPKV